MSKPLDFLLPQHSSYWLETPAGDIYIEENVSVEGKVEKCWDKHLAQEGSPPISLSQRKAESPPDRKMQIAETVKAVYKSANVEAEDRIQLKETSPLLLDALASSSEGIWLICTDNKRLFIPYSLGEKIEWFKKDKHDKFPPKGDTAIKFSSLTIEFMIDLFKSKGVLEEEFFGEYSFDQIDELVAAIDYYAPESELLDKIIDHISVNDHKRITISEFGHKIALHANNFIAQKLYLKILIRLIWGGSSKSSDFTYVYLSKTEFESEEELQAFLCIPELYKVNNDCKELLVKKVLKNPHISEKAKMRAWADWYPENPMGNQTDAFIKCINTLIPHDVSVEEAQQAGKVEGYVLTHLSMKEEQILLLLDDADFSDFQKRVQQHKQYWLYCSRKPEWQRNLSDLNALKKPRVNSKASLFEAVGFKFGKFGTQE